MTPNPYNVSLHVEGSDYYGRAKLVNSVLTSKNKLVWLRGNRRTGKTSTLYQILYSPQANSRYLIYFLDFGKVTCYQDLAYLLQSVVFEDDTRTGTARQVRSELSEYQNLDFFELQRLLVTKAAEKKLKLLLLCDEFEALIEIMNEDQVQGSNLLRRLRHEWEKLDLRVILSATGRLSRLKNYESGLVSPLLIQLQSLFIAQLNPSDAIELIEQSHQPSDRIKVDKNTASSIVRLTGGHPYLIQHLCSELFDEEEGKLRAIQVQILDKVLHLLTSYFAIDFEGLTSQEQSILVELSKLNLHAGSSVQREQLKLQVPVPYNEFHEALHNLIYLGMIDELTGDALAINNYFLFNWLVINKTNRYDPGALQAFVRWLVRHADQSVAQAAASNNTLQAVNANIASKSENKKLCIFISYAKEDRIKARSLYEQFLKDGFDPWLDEERLLPGQNWSLEIQKALHDSDVVVLCFSKSSVAKEGYVHREFNQAMEYAKEKPEGMIYVIPIRLDDCEPPRFIREYHWVNYPADYSRLYKALQWRAADFVPGKSTN